MSESKSNEEAEVEANEQNRIKLRNDQLEVLARHENLGRKSELVSPEEKRLLDTLAVDAEAVSEMDNPAVVDRAGLSRDNLNDALASLRAVNEPVVVSESEAESLSRARDGLSSIVANAYGMSEDAASRMSVDALASAVESYGDEGLKTMDQLSQTPESGSSHDIDASAATPDGVEALSAGERDDIRDKITKHDRMKERTPKHAESLKQSALEMVDGIDDFDELREEIN